MKTKVSILVFACILALLGLSACKNGPITQQQAAADALADAAAAANGYLAGGQAGAALGLTVQEVANLNAIAAKAKTTAAAAAVATTPPASVVNPSAPVTP